MTPTPRLQHIALPIRDGDQDGVRAFYAGVLGLTEKSVPAAVAHYGFVWFAAGPGDLELHFIPDPVGAVGAEERHICLEVADLDVTRHELRDAGREPFETFPVPGPRPAADLLP